MFSEPTSLQCQIFALQTSTDNIKWRPHENVKNNTQALVFEKKTGRLDPELQIQGLKKFHSLVLAVAFSILLGVSGPEGEYPSVRYPPLHVLRSSRTAKYRNVPGELRKTTWTSGSEKPSHVSSFTLISRTKGHCSKIGYFLHFSNRGVGRMSLWDLRLYPPETWRHGQ